MFKRFLLSFALLFCMTGAGAWQPDRAIKIVVPYPAGGATDNVVRTIQAPLSKQLGVPVIVENMPGANGVVGSVHVAKSKPDAHTLVLIVASSHTIAPNLKTNLPYDTIRDFTPIAMISSEPLLLVTATKSPFNTVPELIAYAAKNPNRVNYGSWGVGSAPHLAGELLFSTGRAQATHVPYSGIAPATMATINGEVTVLFGGVATLMPHVTSGSLKILGTANTERIFPTVPAISEQYPGFNVYTWFGLAGPANLPSEAVTQLNLAINRVLSDAEVRDIYNKQGRSVLVTTPKQMRDFLISDRQRWAQVIQNANIPKSDM